MIPPMSSSKRRRCGRAWATPPKRTKKNSQEFGWTGKVASRASERRLTPCCNVHSARPGVEAPPAWLGTLLLQFWRQCAREGATSHWALQQWSSGGGLRRRPPKRGWTGGVSRGFSPPAHPTSGIISGRSRTGSNCKTGAVALTYSCSSARVRILRACLASNQCFKF
jgi:hypothetical protein